MEPPSPGAERPDRHHRLRLGQLEHSLGVSSQLQPRSAGPWPTSSLLEHSLNQAPGQECGPHRSSPAYPSILQSCRKVHGKMPRPGASSAPQALLGNDLAELGRAGTVTLHHGGCHSTPQLQWRGGEAEPRPARAGGRGVSGWAAGTACPHTASWGHSQARKDPLQGCLAPLPPQNIADLFVLRPPQDPLSFQATKSKI